LDTALNRRRRSRPVFEGRVSGYCISQNYLLLASVVWALYSSWSYKTQLFSETVREAWVLFLHRLTDYIIHCWQCRGHSSKAYLETLNM